MEKSEIFLGESLFSLSELKIISEFHTDVISTPVEQLVPAFDYVKSHVLGGKPYHRDDHTKVSLELKKFLASSMEENTKPSKRKQYDRRKWPPMNVRSANSRNKTQTTCRPKSLV